MLLLKKILLSPVKNWIFGNAAKIGFLHKPLSRVPKLWVGTVDTMRMSLGILARKDKALTAVLSLLHQSQVSEVKMKRTAIVLYTKRKLIKLDFILEATAGIAVPAFLTLLLHRRLCNQSRSIMTT